MSSRSLAGIANRIPAQVLIVTSALIQYSGAAVAVFAFSVVEPASVAWWRGFVGALVLCAWVRPCEASTAQPSRARFISVSLWSV